MSFQIAIDGPGGSGKSSVARELARRLGFLYIDTGAMYRAVALNARNCGADWQNEASVTASLGGISIDLRHIGGAQALFLDNINVTDDLRTAEMGMGASAVSRYEAVRRELVRLQQKMAAGANVVMDGRDIGTVVLPGADIKIYMDAAPEIRARRRCDELDNLGQSYDYKDILEQIISRDLQDSTREISPLKVADGAVIIDTGHMGFEEVVSELIDIVRARRAIDNRLYGCDCNCCR